MEKLHRAWLYICLLLLIFSSCKEEFDYGLGDFRIDLATVTETTTERCYLLDNQIKLIPTKAISSEVKTGSRVLLNYNLLELKSTNEYSVKVNSASQVFTSGVKELPGNLSDDPLLLESIWQSGDWINFRLTINYRSTTHGIALYQNKIPANDTVYLELRHSKNNDTEGYALNIYASFLVKGFAKDEKSVPLKIKVNTSDQGVKYYKFDYLSPSQD